MLTPAPVHDRLLRRVTVPELVEMLSWHPFPTDAAIPVHLDNAGSPRQIILGDVWPAATRLAENQGLGLTTPPAPSRQRSPCLRLPSRRAPPAASLPPSRSNYATRQGVRQPELVGNLPTCRSTLCASTYAFLIVSPPSTGMAVPVRNEAAGSTADGVICATSSGAA